MAILFGLATWLCYRGLVSDIKKSMQRGLEYRFFDEAINHEPLQGILLDSFSHKMVGYSYGSIYGNCCLTFEDGIEKFVADSCFISKKAGEFKISIHKGDSIKEYSFKVLDHQPKLYSKFFSN